MMARKRYRGPNRRTGGYLGIELKFYDTKLVGAALASPVDATGGEHNPTAVICLNTVTAGTGEEQRIGRKITMHSIGIRGVVNCAPQTGVANIDAATEIFIALVHDKQTNGALLNSEDVFTNKGANAILATSLWNNLQFKDRFNVLATRKFNMQNPTAFNDAAATGNGEQAGLQQVFQIFVNLKGMKTLYKATTETIANIIDNSLTIVAFCNNTGLVPQISYNARLRFTG